MKNKKRITFYVNENEYKNLLREANECNISVNAYVKQKSLEETDAVNLKRTTSLVMAELYLWSNQITDLTAREYMKKGADILCRSLR